MAGRPEPLIPQAHPFTTRSKEAAKRTPLTKITMSQQANKLLEELLDSNPDGLPWDRVVREVKRTCSVKENTAETYIRRSDKATKELTSSGDKMVISPQESGETVIHDEDEILEMEVGDPTSRTFGELTVLEDIGHPEVPSQHENGYIRRRMAEGNSGLARKTDVQVVTSVMSDPDFSTLLIGKHGVGKDKLVLHICANTNRPVIRLVANDDPDFIDLLVGTYAPDGEGNFTHKKGLLTVAIENGYTFILDEFNTLSGKVQSMLNKILEGADSNKFAIPETNEIVEPHPEFQFVGTQNPNEVGYGGREDVDQATGSRFIPVEIPPLGEQGEKKVVAGQTHWDENSPELDKLLREDGGVISGLRNLHDMGKVSMWTSTRDVIQIGRMAEKLGDIEAAAELVLVGRAQREDKDPIKSNINDQRW